MLLFISQLIIYCFDNRELEEKKIQNQGSSTEFYKTMLSKKEQHCTNIFSSQAKRLILYLQPSPQPSFLNSITEMFLPTCRSNNLLYRERKRPPSNQGTFQN